MGVKVVSHQMHLSFHPPAVFRDNDTHHFPKIVRLNLNLLYSGGASCLVILFRVVGNIRGFSEIYVPLDKFNLCPPYTPLI